MIIAPAEHNAPNESSDPVEVLIKEARQKARRRRLTVGVVLLAAVFAVVVVLLVTAGGEHPRPKATTSDTADRPATSSAPKCNILNLNEAYGGKISGDGVTYDIIRFTNEKTTCVVGRVTLHGINLNASEHEVGPSLTSNSPALVTLRHDQSAYLPVGVVDTHGIPPLGKCNAAEITGMQIHFPWNRKYFDNAYVGFGDQTVCTSRVSFTVAPYQSKA